MWLVFELENIWSGSFNGPSTHNFKLTHGPCTPNPRPSSNLASYKLNSQKDNYFIYLFSKVVLVYCSLVLDILWFYDVFVNLKMEAVRGYVSGEVTEFSVKFEDQETS